jgi:hypothetical protein
VAHRGYGIDRAPLLARRLDGYRLFWPRIYWGGAGPGWVETEFQIYPFVVALLYGVFGERFWLGRLVSWAATAGASVLFLRLARRLCGEAVAPWALAFFLIAPLYLRYSVQFMPEATLIFFWLAAIVAFVAWLDGHAPALWWCGAATALALLVKPTSLHLGLLFLLLLWRNGRLGTLARGRMWAFAALCLLPPTAWYLHARQIYLEYGNTFGLFSGGDSKFGHVLDYWTDPGFYRALVRLEMKEILGYTMVVPLVVGFWTIARRDRSGVVGLGSLTVAISYLVIPRYASFANYYHLYSVPFVALAVGAGARFLFVEAGAQRLARVAWRALGVMATAPFLVGVGGFWVMLLQEEHYDPTCAYLVGRLVPPEQRIVMASREMLVDDLGPNNYQNPNVMFFSGRHGWSMALEQHDPVFVDTVRAQGAKWLVSRYGDFPEDFPELAAYLDRNATQLGPGFEESCAIFRFEDR